MPERSPKRPDYRPHQGLHSRHSEVSAGRTSSSGPPRRHAQRQPSPGSESTTLGAMLADVKVKDRYAKQDTHRDQDASRISTNSYRSSSQSMSRRPPSGYRGSDQRPYRDKSDRKHPRIEYPGERRPGQSRRSGPPYTISPIRTSSSSRRHSPPPRSRTSSRSRSPSLFFKKSRVDETPRPVDGDSPAASPEICILEQEEAPAEPKTIGATEPAALPDKVLLGENGSIMERYTLREVVQESRGKDGRTENAEFRIKSLKRSHPETSDSDSDRSSSRSPSPESDNTFANKQERPKKMVSNLKKFDETVQSNREELAKKTEECNIVERELKQDVMELKKMERPMKKRKKELREKREAQEKKHLETLTKFGDEVGLFAGNPAAMNSFLKQNNYSVLLENMKKVVETTESEEKEMAMEEDKINELRGDVELKISEKKKLDEELKTLRTEFMEHCRHRNKMDKKFATGEFVNNFQFSSEKKRSKPKKAKIVSVNEDAEKEAKRLVRKHNREGMLKKSGEQTSEGNKGVGAAKNVPLPVTEEDPDDPEKGPFPQPPLVPVNQNEAAPIQKAEETVSETEAPGKGTSGEQLLGKNGAVVPEPAIEKGPLPPHPIASALQNDAALAQKTRRAEILESENQEKDKAGGEPVVEKEAPVPALLNDNLLPPLPPVPAIQDAATSDQNAKREEMSGEMSVAPFQEATRKHKEAETPGKKQTSEVITSERMLIKTSVTEKNTGPFPQPPLVPVTQSAAAPILKADETVSETEAPGKGACGEQLIGKKRAVIPEPTLKKDPLPPQPSVPAAMSEAASFQKAKRSGSPEAVNQEKARGEHVAVKEAAVPEPVQDNNLLPSEATASKKQMESERIGSSESRNQENEKTGETSHVQQDIVDPQPALDEIRCPKLQSDPVLQNEAALVRRTEEAQTSVKETTSEIAAQKLAECELKPLESERIGSSESGKQEKEKTGGNHVAEKEAAFPVQSQVQHPISPDKPVSAAMSKAALVQKAGEAEAPRKKVASEVAMPAVFNIPLPPPPPSSNPPKENSVKTSGTFNWDSIRGASSQLARPKIGAKTVLLPTPSGPPRAPSAHPVLNGDASMNEECAPHLPQNCSLVLPPSRPSVATSSSASSIQSIVAAQNVAAPGSNVAPHPAPFRSSLELWKGFFMQKHSGSLAPPFTPEVACPASVGHISVSTSPASSPRAASPSPAPAQKKGPVLNTGFSFAMRDLATPIPSQDASAASTAPSSSAPGPSSTPKGKKRNPAPRPEPSGRVLRSSTK